MAPAALLGANLSLHAACLDRWHQLYGAGPTTTTTVSQWPTDSILTARHWYLTTVPDSGIRQQYPTTVPNSGTRQQYPTAVPDNGTRQRYPTAVPDNDTQQTVPDSSITADSILGMPLENQQCMPWSQTSHSPSP